MRTLATVACLVVALSCRSIAAQEVAESTKSDEENWIQLFNGKDLTGWTPKIRGYELGENFGDTFRVKDGKIVVGYEAYDKFNQRYGHLFYKTPYSHYRIRAEYRFVGEQANGGEGWAYRNSGLMLHGQTPESMTKGQDFPVSIEVQLLGGNAQGERTNANLCTPGTNVVMDGKLIKQHCTSSTSKTCRGDEWFTVEVEVKGSEGFRHFVDGEEVLSYQSPQLDESDENARKLIKDGKLLLDGGTISIQSESHPVEFRKIELLDLSKE